VILCERCGAPLIAAAGGGAAACRYCGAQHVVAMRVADPGAARSRAFRGEAERLAHLRAQDGRRAPAPERVAALAPGGRLAPARAAEALALFQRLVAARSAASEYDAAEEMFSLARALGDRFGEDGDRLRQRAVLESALEALSLPRHRQVLGAELAVCACRAGDLEAAEAWLSACDPVSDDRAADSAYRFARAYVDTAAGRPAAVLRALGAGPVEVPITDELLPACAVLRANAWERLGQPAVAVDLLLSLKHDAGPFARYRARRFLAQHTAAGMCARSEPEAEARYQAATARRLPPAGDAERVLTLMAGYFLLVAAGAIVITILEAADVARVVGSAFEAGLVAFSMLLVGGIMAMLVIGSGSERKRRARLRTHGVFAPARVEHVRVTEDDESSSRSLHVDLLVMPESGAPYRAEVEDALLPEDEPPWARGAMVLARIHPEIPSLVAIEDA
jgi:DNA-directed RNA polymerase subunit RPC12/RpoP